MVGILKNKSEHSGTVSQSTKEFREEVLKNTKLNAQLQSEEHKKIVAKQQQEEAEQRALQVEQERLQWNKKNLEDNEVIQKQILENMETTIDEPKTPFQHATEVNEYYKEDEDELEDFSLGAPEFSVPSEEEESTGVPVERVESHVSLGGVPDPSELHKGQPPDHHMTFEEKKKLHYHHEAPQFHPVEDADDDGEDEAPEKKMSFAEKRKLHYSKEHVPKE